MSPEDVFVLPDIRRKRVSLRTTATSGRVHAGIAGTTCQVEGPAGELAIDFPELLPWTPDAPALYTLNVTLTDERGNAQSASLRFGAREFSVKDNRFHLNGRPLHLKGIHHTFEYPADADRAALMRQEITLARDAGFALIHLHGNGDLAPFLDLADEIGMLVWLDLPSEENLSVQQAFIEAHRNHACVAAWVGQHAGPREADATRLMLLPSTNARPGRGLIKPFRAELEPFDDVHLVRRAPVGPQTEDLLRACGQPDQLSFLAMFGFGGLSPAGLALGSEASERAREALATGHADRDLASTFDSPEAIATAAAALQSDAIRYQIDAARANPKLAGYCWVQLCDSSERYAAGLLDVHRNPKPAYDVAKRIHKPMRPLIQMTATNLRPRQEVPVTVVLANEERLEGRCDISLQVVGPTNQVLWKKRRASKLPRHAKELWNGAIGASGSPGKHRFIVRVLDGTKILAEAGQDFNVYETPAPCDVSFHLVDPRNEWTPRLASFKLESILTPVIIVPPLTNSVAGYPDEVLQVLAQVKAGAVAVFFAPPADWNELAERVDDSLTLHPCDATGGLSPALHYAKVHPIFDGAQSRCLMRQAFRYVAPQSAFQDVSDEDIASTFNTWLLEQDDAKGAWASDVVVRRFGGGRVVFTHLRILESLGTDPLADRLFVNLLNHCARRAVSPGGYQPAPTKAAEWLKNARGVQSRRWMVIGEFPNWNGTGHNTVYPPETAIDLAARYPGWHGPVGWRNWQTSARDGHRMDFHAALNFRDPGLSHANSGTAYAHAEFSAERRQDARFTLISAHACKVWLNGALVLSREQPDDFRISDSMSPVLIKQGRNTLLIKSSQSFGAHAIEAGLSSASREPLMISWLR